MSEFDAHDDEALSALIDGSLPSESAAALRRRLEREPALAARLEAMQRANRAVHDAYRGVVDEPLPQRVLELLRESRAAGENVVEIKPGRARRATPAWFPQALAAGIVLAVGLGLGFTLGQRETEPTTLLAATGAVRAGSPLHELLESAPSGVARSLDGAATAEARFTFRTEGGGWCRELAVSTAAGQNAALVCRRAGAWRVELVGVGPAGGELYRPAGEASPFEEAIDAVIDGEPLESDAERALLATGWSSD